MADNERIALASIKQFNIYFGTETEFYSLGQGSPLRDLKKEPLSLGAKIAKCKMYSREKFCVNETFVEPHIGEPALGCTLGIDPMFTNAYQY